MVQKYQSPVRIYKYPFELVMAVSGKWVMSGCAGGQLWWEGGAQGAFSADLGETPLSLTPPRPRFCLLHISQGLSFPHGAVSAPSSLTP